MKQLFTYSFVGVIILGSLWGCEDDDRSFSLDPVVGLTEGFIPAVEEGDTAVITVGIFFSGALENNINVNWSTQGADNRSGLAVIEAGSTRADIRLAYPDNTVVDAERQITLTISTTDLPTTGKFGGTSVTYNIVDDLKSFSLGTGGSPDTIVISEVMDIITGELESSAAIDEEIEFTLEVDPASTAIEGTDYRLPNGNTFTVEAGSDQNPAFEVEIVNNEISQAPRFLKLNLTGLTASPESSIVTGLANSIVYKIEDDPSIIKIDRLDPEVEVHLDTLQITTSGTYQFSTLIDGGEITGTVSFEVEPDFSKNPGLVDEIALIAGTTVFYVPGESSKPFRFEVRKDLFTQSGSTHYVTFNLDNITTSNMDSEVIFDPDGEVSLVLEIKDE